MKKISRFIFIGLFVIFQSDCSIRRLQYTEKNHLDLEMILVHRYAPGCEAELTTQKDSGLILHISFSQAKPAKKSFSVPDVFQKGIPDTFKLAFGAVYVFNTKLASFFGDELWPQVDPKYVIVETTDKAGQRITSYFQCTPTRKWVEVNNWPGDPQIVECKNLTLRRVVMRRVDDEGLFEDEVVYQYASVVGQK
jgi:hypothetical protein